MRPISFDGKVFSDYLLDAKIVRGLPGDDRSGQWLNRRGAGPLSTGITRGARSVAVNFYRRAIDASTSDDLTEARIITLLGELDLGNEEPRALVVELPVYNTGTGLVDLKIVSVPAVIGPYNWLDSTAKGVQITFYALTSIWREAAFVSDLANGISSSGSSFTVNNTGKATAYPIYKVGYTVQRSGSTAAVGWKYRKTITLVNNESRTETRETRFIDMGSTTALVSGSKALASGDDVRVRLNGRELPRTLINWNTGRTFIAVVVTILPFSSITVDIVYGNPSALVPETLNTLGGARTRPDLFTALDCLSDSGTATAGAVGSLTNTGKAMIVNRLRGGFIQIISGTGAGQKRRILSNTATQVVPDRNFTTAPASGSVYVIWTSGVYVNGGAVSAATSTTLTDSSQTWGTNSLVGGTVTVDSTGETRAITACTGTVLTVSPAFGTTPLTLATYSIERPGFHRYGVDQSVKRGSNDVWLGTWYQDARYSQPGVVQTAADGIANAWQPYLMLRNNDAYAQKSVTPVNFGGGDIDFFNGLDTNRGIGRDNPFKEQGTADGITVTNPHGYDAAYYDYQFKNPNGICQFVLSMRTNGGIEFQTVTANAGTSASLAPVAAAWADLTVVDDPALHLYMGVLPASADEQNNIPSTFSTNDVATARSYQRLELFLNLRNWSNGALSAEQAIYDLNATLQLAAIGAVPPYCQISFGGPGHYLHLTSTQKVWLRTDPDSTEPMLAIYDGTTLVQRVAWAAVVYDVIADVEGNAVATVSQEFAPLVPGNNTVTVIEPAIGNIYVDVVFQPGYQG